MSGTVNLRKSLFPSFLWRSPKGGHRVNKTGSHRRPEK
jgi:hypothetical protein